MNMFVTVPNVDFVNFALHAEAPNYNFRKLLNCFTCRNCTLQIISFCFLTRGKS